MRRTRVVVEEKIPQINQKHTIDVKPEQKGSAPAVVSVQNPKSGVVGAHGSFHPSAA